MSSLFGADPAPMPALEGSSWTVSSAEPPKPPPVRHAEGYERFVAFVESLGVDPVSLLDTWRFAHLIRRERRALLRDPALRRSAVIFLGNAIIRLHPDLEWHDHEANGAFLRNRTTLEEVDGRWVEVPDPRHLGVEGTVSALLHADADRLREFGRVVADFGWTDGSTLHPV